MDKSSVSRLSRRSAIVTAGAAALAALTHQPASAAQTEPSAPRFSDSIPPEWAAWKGMGADNLGDLLGNMVTETTTSTWWPDLETEETIAINWLTQFGLHKLLNRLDLISVRKIAAQQDTSLELGFALAMTRDQAPRGPEAWYRAALAYSNIVLMTDEEEKAAYARLDEATEENYRLNGYVKIAKHDEGKEDLA